MAYSNRDVTERIATLAQALERGRDKDRPAHAHHALVHKVADSLRELGAMHLAIAAADLALDQRVGRGR